LSLMNLAIASEAFIVGTKAGLDPEAMLEVINNGSGQNSATLDKIPNHVLTRTFDFGGALYLAHKDIGAFLEEARRLGLSTPPGEAALAAFQRAAAQGTVSDDIMEIFRYQERLAGTEIAKTRSRP